VDASLGRERGKKKLRQVAAESNKYLKGKINKECEKRSRRAGAAPVKLFVSERFRLPKPIKCIYLSAVKSRKNPEEWLMSGRVLNLR